MLPFNLSHYQEEKKRKKEEEDAKKKAERAKKMAEFEKFKNPPGTRNFVITKRAGGGLDEVRSVLIFTFIFQLHLIVEIENILNMIF